MLPGKPNWSDWSHFCTIFFKYYADYKNMIFLNSKPVFWFFTQRNLKNFLRFSEFFETTSHFWTLFFLNFIKSRKISPSDRCKPFWIRLENKKVIAFSKDKSACHTPWFKKKLFFGFSHFLFLILIDTHRVTSLKLSQNLNSYLNEAARRPQTVGEQIFKFK